MIEQVRVCNICSGTDWVPFVPFGAIDPESHVCGTCGAPIEASHFEERAVVLGEENFDEVRRLKNFVAELETDIAWERQRGERLQRVILEFWTAISRTNPRVNCNRAMTGAEVAELLQPEAVKKFREEAERIKKVVDANETRDQGRDR
jgi:hypothetical protein